MKGIVLAAFDVEGSVLSIEEKRESPKSNYVVEKRTDLKTACVEEIALRYKWSQKDKLAQDIQDLKGECYSYLKRIIER